MRTCNRCEREKELSAFRRYRASTNGRWYRRRVCSECMDAAAQRWVRKNQQRYRKWYRDYYDRTREKQIRRASNWNRKNPDRKRQKSQSWYRQLRHEAIMAYGGYVCSCCGESEPTFLTIDHVNNDAWKYRRTNSKGYKVGPHSGGRLLSWLKRSGYPEGFQVLCANCNQGKAVSGTGVCPHLVDKVQRPSRNGSRLQA